MMYIFKFLLLSSFMTKFVDNFSSMGSNLIDNNLCVYFLEFNKLYNVHITIVKKINRSVSFHTQNLHKSNMNNFSIQTF